MSVHLITLVLNELTGNLLKIWSLLQDSMVIVCGEHVFVPAMVECVGCIVANTIQLHVCMAVWSGTFYELNRGCYVLMCSRLMNIIEYEYPKINECEWNCCSNAKRVEQLLRS